MRVLLSVANLLVVVAFLLRLNHLPPQIPLMYSRPWGEFQLVDWWMILMLPVMMNLLYIANGIIKKRYFAVNEFAARVLHYMNIFIIITCTIVFIKIVFLVS